MKKNELLSLLEENKYLQDIVKKHLITVAERVKELENHEEFLLLYHEITRKTNASRAPLDRASLIKKTLKYAETINSSSDVEKSPMMWSRKRTFDEVSGSSKNEKEDNKPEFYLNRYVPIEPYNVRTEDPFMDAGLCGSPKLIRVLLKPCPLSREAQKVRNIMSVYNFLDKKMNASEISNRKTPKPSHDDEIREEMSSFSRESYDKDDGLPMYSPARPKQTCLEEKEKILHRFKSFLISKKAEEIIQCYWEDKYTLQEHLKKEYSYQLAMEMELCRDAEHKYNNDSQIYFILNAANNVVLEYFITPIRLSKIASCLPSTLFCSESVLFVKRLQSNKNSDVSKRCAHPVVRQKIMKELLKQAGAFPKSRLPDVYAALGV